MRIDHAVVIACVMVLLTSGCHRRLECPSSNDLRAMDMRGRWVVEITPDSARDLPEAALARPLKGHFKLRTRDSSQTGVVYTGDYNADFKSVGVFKTRDQALAYTPKGDTFEIILNPNVDHGNIALVAHCSAGKMSGRWRLNSDPAAAWGHFTLDKRDGE